MNQLKRILWCGALAGSLVLTSGAFAQSGDTTQDQPPQGQGQMGGMHRGGPGMMNPDARLQHMTKVLNLTADQQAKIKPILEDAQTQMQQLHSDSSMTPQDRHTKMQQIHEQTQSQINAVLTPEQQQKMKQMMEQRQERMHNHGGMGQGAGSEGGSTPPQQ